MKIYPITILFITLFVNPFTASVSKAQQANNKTYAVNCSTWDCIEKNKNKDVTIKGAFRKYTPNKTGKGAQQMFWDWEIVLDQDLAVPVKSTNNKINYAYFEGKKVLIKGNIFYGIVIGHAGEQNATGFRIDAVEIELDK